MTYEEALHYVHNTLKFGMRLGLHGIGSLLELMDNPQQKLKYVHVAGTNGKGSTAAFISSILMEAGYKVGIYTSPYLERFTERIKINHTEIAEDDLARLVDLVKSKVEIMVREGKEHPTEFEIITAVAFQYFYEMGCDVVVLEVGLGGRFDATNIIDTPLVSVITTISYDHTAILGDTLPKIAFEKAGIIKENGDVVLYPQADEVEAVFYDACARKGSRLHRADFKGLKLLEAGRDGQVFDWGDFKALKIFLLGAHQMRNAVVALTACEILGRKGYSITEAAVRQGLEKACWPGRLEVVSKKPLFIIDGAHNAEGARVLAETLDGYFPDKRKIFIIGVLKDKDYPSMIEAVVPLAWKVITVTPENDRALPAEELAISISPYCKSVTVSDTIESAVAASLDTAADGDMVCAFGSLYYIGKVRSMFVQRYV